MKSSPGPRTLIEQVGALFGSSYPGIELVMTAIGWAALAVGGAVAFQLRAGLGTAVVMVGITYVVLTLLLLYRGTFWIAALLGSTIVAASGALLGAALGAEFLATAGTWAGGIAGFLATGLVSLHCYRRVSVIVAERS